MVAQGERNRIAKLLHLLTPLKRTPTGRMVYAQVERILRETTEAHYQIERAYTHIAHALLDAGISKLPADSIEQSRLRLLQALIQPPLTPYELDSLRRFVERYAEEVAKTKAIEMESLETAVTPLLEAFDLSERIWTETELSQVQPTAQAAEQTHERNGKAEFRVDSAYRHRLDYARKRIEKLQNELAQKVRSIVTPHEEFRVTVETLLGKLREATDRDQLSALKENLIAESAKMVNLHRGLAEKLDGTLNHLAAMKSDSQRLTDELNRVYLLSLTDDLTDLPNRRAFLRRLEDEISRVQRYNTPLSLTLIDIDRFKGINDQFGHSVGDAVLRIYATKILSIFRHHDVVCRFGGEEFAVVFPNTTLDGANSAMIKVLRRARKSRFRIGDERYAIPTLSAGLAQYRLGETSNLFIKRADQALYRAKGMGRDRVVLDAGEQSGDTQRDQTPSSE